MAAVLAANHSRIWLTLSLLLFLSILTGPVGAQDPTPTIVSVFLPSYGPTDWAALRGSILSRNDAETTYTIFCAPDQSHSCNIGGGTLLPFTFAEGPSTYHYERTIDSTISITQACLLSDTTAATCSGSTSLGSITLGPLSGPSSTSVAPFTLTGASVRWGALTLAAPPLTSTASGLTFTYYGSGAPESTASSDAVATATMTMDNESATGTSSAQPGTTSGAGSLRWRCSGSETGVTVGFLVAILVCVLLW
ncbi:uncharacterized protein F4807DRAFT_166390 [Annulohypoxylon truncatum]|uniref:uncharacterized protein n=1 Tax=Annulohypoxylon truncatum TaxID=327061 RepID=UPI0020080194|nr:uncharacterized protein F4807DRAFT_166390 [Annulohypoxylon truncatum]KAI1207767.1 hypothetical protein F4807DRAFT_166390 [Annulohypoxylon truncatum]